MPPQKIADLSHSIQNNGEHIHSNKHRNETVRTYRYKNNIYTLVFVNDMLTELYNDTKGIELFKEN